MRVGLRSNLRHKYLNRFVLFVFPVIGLTYQSCNAGYARQLSHFFWECRRTSVVASGNRVGSITVFLRRIAPRRVRAATPLRSLRSREGEWRRPGLSPCRPFCQRLSLRRQSH